MSAAAPFPPDEPSGHTAYLEDPDRLAALAVTDLLGSLPEEAYDRVTRLATQLTGVPVGLFSLVTDQRQFFKARTGLNGANADLQETLLNSSFCQYVVTADTPLAIADARSHPLLSGNAAVDGLGVIAYLGVPIHAPTGHVIGSLCAIDHVARDWTEAHLAALHDLAAIIETELRLRRNMAERALIGSELNHRIKNLFTIVSGMVRLSRRAHDNAADMASDIEARIGALANAHQLIIPDGATGPTAGGAGLAPLITAILAPYLGEGSQDRCQMNGPAMRVGAQATTSLALIFHELATNSAKYGALGQVDAVLHLDWRQKDGSLHLDWDERTGQPSTLGETTGFGSQLLEMTVEGQLQGQIQTSTTPTGLLRRLVIPLDALLR
ncbi:HWE histidine kinase domain-containing protein [Paracoccus tegillarcae]|uniref:histidine kinase n=1 Tax=Paracoccus tegillarcae TaxID=1529068 RepID=A0A2K9ED66_9RHOB|nr:HWE histidine kinase domain-containing protein [Paracoccus tegillarcae]AUH32888.1 histidine kinase [Paracoccus tegillarcae]